VLARARSPIVKRETREMAILKGFMRRAFLDADGNVVEKTCEEMEDFILFPSAY
jgi:hypothetical protein